MKIESTGQARYIGQGCSANLARMLVPIQQCGTFNRLANGTVVELTEAMNLPGREDGRKQYFACNRALMQPCDFLVVEGDFEIL